MKTTSKRMVAVIIVVLCSFLSLYSQSYSEFYYEGLKEIQSDTCSCMVKYYMDSASRKIVESKEYRAGRLVFKGQYSGKIRNVYHYEYDTLGRICYFYSSSTDGRSYTTHGYVIYDQMRFRVVSNYFNNLYFVDVLEDSTGYRMAISINNKLVDSAKTVSTKEGNLTIKRSFYGSSAIAQKSESYDSLGKIVAYENYDDTGGVLAQGSYQYDSINRIIRLDVDYNYSFEDCVKKSERYHYSDKEIFSSQADKIQRICVSEKGREVVYTTYVQTE